MNVDFGEHICNNLNEILTGLAISLLGAFFGFGFALLINYYFNKRLKRKDQDKLIKLYKDRLNYLILFIDSVADTSIKQLYKYIEYAKILRKEPFNLLNTPKILATFDFERLKNYSSDSLLEAYLYFDKNSDEGLNDYKFIFSNADFFNKKFGEYPKERDRYATDIYKQQQLVRKKLESIAIDIRIKSKNIQKLNPNNYIDNEEFKYLNKFAEIYVEISQGLLNFDKVREFFLIPIHNTIFDTDINSLFADDLFKQVKITLSIIENIESNAHHYANILEMDSSKTKIKTARKNLLNAKDKIKELIQNNREQEFDKEKNKTFWSFTIIISILGIVLSYFLISLVNTLFPDTLDLIELLVVLPIIAFVFWQISRKYNNKS